MKRNDAVTLFIKFFLVQYSVEKPSFSTVEIAFKNMYSYHTQYKNTNITFKRGI